MTDAPESTQPIVIGPEGDEVADWWVANCELIVKAHNYLPQLLSEIEGMRQALDDTGSVYMHIDCDDSDHVEIEKLRSANEVLIAELLALREWLSRFEAVGPWVETDDGITCVACYVDMSSHHEPDCPWAGVGE